MKTALYLNTVIKLSSEFIILWTLNSQVKTFLHVLLVASRQGGFIVPYLGQIVVRKKTY